MIMDTAAARADIDLCADRLYHRIMDERHDVYPDAGVFAPGNRKPFAELRPDLQQSWRDALATILGEAP